ncbi:MAG TPA: DNA polymerase III subunit delta [Bryobacteraceae bacterium]|nr:DNA polymerase III subunit delta [Bryobacteraceae bacterium]
MPVSPQQLIRSLERQKPAPVYLFLGPEGWYRKACREAVAARTLGADSMGEGVTSLDLESHTLAEIIDDARAMSLFAADRVIWVSNAESALPRGRATDEPDSAGAGLLAAYCADPTPGTVLIFDARRYEFEGEDKTKVERLRKFYAPIQAVVEFPHPSSEESASLARQFCSEFSLTLGKAEFDLLLDATAGDPSRLHNEIQKLALYAQDRGGKITRDDIFALVPNSSETTIFALVDALARRNRAQAMELLDRLVRDGEYLPLALTFLGGVFRMALTAREQNLRGAMDVQSYFQRMGLPMWRSRAEQIHAAAQRFSKEKLEEGIGLVFRADRDMKGSRPDDRIVMEDFVFRLTG